AAQPLNLRLECDDLIAEGFAALRDRIGLFFEQRHFDLTNATATPARSRDRPTPVARSRPIPVCKAVPNFVAAKPGEAIGRRLPVALPRWPHRKGSGTSYARRSTPSGH